MLRLQQKEGKRLFIVAISYQIYEDKYQKQIISLILEIQRSEFGIDVSLDKQKDLKEIPNFYQKDAGNFLIKINKNSLTFNFSYCYNVNYKNN